MELHPIKLPLRVLCAPHTWVLKSWLVDFGAYVHKGERVCSLRSRTTSAVEYALAPCEGKLVSKRVEKDGEIGDGEVVGMLEDCGHAVVFGGVCAVCGKDVSEVHFARGRFDAERMEVAYAGEGLSLTRREAQAMEARTARRLFAERKLSLVLDLDHTLVHATDDPKAKILIDKKKKEMERSDKTGESHASEKPHADTSVNGDPKEKKEQGEDGTAKDATDSVKKDASGVLADVHELRLPKCPQPMYVKLRPGLRKFLKTCAALFELHIYTMGTGPYADKIASLIDPDKSLFAGRVTSRDHYAEGKMNQKNLSRLFPCDDSMVIILDDREDVWLEPGKFHVNSYIPNLIRARPYTFWNGLREVYDRRSLNGDSAGNREAATSKAPLAQKPGSPSPLPLQAGDPVSGTKISVVKASEASGLGPHVPSAFPQMRVDHDLLHTIFNVQEDDRLHPDSPPHLEQLSSVLVECHRRFFKQASKVCHIEPTDSPRRAGSSPKWTSPADVKDILESMRKEVLKGCVITFSRLWPPLVYGPTVPIYRVAERYGAKCKELLDWEVTHVVAHRWYGADSDKSRLARVDKNRCLVGPEWIRESCEAWKKQAESKYAVESTGVDAFRGPDSIHFGLDNIDYDAWEKDQRKTSGSGEGNRKGEENSTEREGVHEKGEHEGANGTLQEAEVWKQEDFDDDDDSFAAALETEMLAETNGMEEMSARKNSSVVCEPEADFERVNEGIKRRRKS